MMCSAQDLNYAFPSAIRVPGIILNFHFSFSNYSIFPPETMLLFSGLVCVTCLLVKSSMMICSFSVIRGLEGDPSPMIGEGKAGTRTDSLAPLANQLLESEPSPAFH